MDFIQNYIGEIIVGVGISFILGIVGMIKAFFNGIDKMEEKLNALESRIDHNEKSDEEIRAWVAKLIDKRMN